MATADVTVMGAGVFGLAVAWACVQRGARVQVIDPQGVGAGASGGIVGALAPHVPEQWNTKKAFQLESLLMADTFWAQVAETGGGDPGYARTGRLQPLADAAAVDLARARIAGADAHWQGRAVWQVTDAQAHAGWAPESATGLCVFDSLSARLHPRRSVAALASAIGARGGVLRDQGAQQGAVVWATGFAGLCATSMGVGVKGQAALLRHDAAAAPQLFVDGLHIVSHADGTVAIGSTSERNWDRPGSTDDALDTLIDRARSVCPVLAGAPVVARWAGVRPRAQSRAPLLGAWPGKPGHYIANGGFKIGFGVAPLVGEVIADLVLAGRDRIPAEFKPSRA